MTDPFTLTGISGSSLQNLPLDQATNQAEFQNFFKEAHSNIVNLGQSDAQALEYTAKVLLDPNSTPLDELTIQQLMSDRLNLTTLISQLSRLVSETARNIINNIR